MKIKVLGCGAAFSTKNWQANYLVYSDDKQYNIMIDCGTFVQLALEEQGMSYRDIQNIYISHLHADHVGGMEYMAFCTFFDQDYHRQAIAGVDANILRKPGLYSQSKLIDKMWNNSLSGGLGSIEGREMKLDDYFNINRMHVNESMYLPGIGTADIIQTVHVMNGYGIVPTFGLMIKSTSKKKIYFTTDTQFNPDQIIVFYKQADLIIQDCETTPWDSKVHANYKKLITLPADIKAKMWLSHYNTVDLPPAKDDGFLGFLKKGQEIDI